MFVTSNVYLNIMFLHIACGFELLHNPFKDNYLPGKVLDKINTHSYSGFVHYAQHYIISEHESICCIRNCYICNDWVYF